MAAAAATIGVCLALAAAPDVPPRFVPAQDFTLAWTHSIEKVRWEEDYAVRFDDQDQPVLIAGRARIKGSAAGMDPPPDAIHENGWYVYQPDPRPEPPLRLTRSGYTPDYDWCVKGSCQPLGNIMPSDGGITLLYPCMDPRPAGLSNRSDDRRHR